MLATSYLQLQTAMHTPHFVPPAPPGLDEPLAAARTAEFHEEVRRDKNNQEADEKPDAERDQENGNERGMSLRLDGEKRRREHGE